MAGLVEQADTAGLNPADLGHDGSSPSSGTTPLIERQVPQVYGHPPSAAAVLGDALGIAPEDARRGILELLKAGFFLGPVEPTNSMLVAYLEALRPAPKRRDSIIKAVAKARVRWKAMAQAGSQVAMSRLAERWPDNQRHRVVPGEKAENDG